MWETAFTVLKILGSLVAIVGGLMIVARVWNGTSRERLIDVLTAELKLAREHCDGADRTVLHYRQEMHDTRTECDGKISKAHQERDEAKDALKAVQIENADLRARTDLSPVMTTMTDFIKEQREFIREQTEINTRVLGALQNLGAKA